MCRAVDLAATGMSDRVYWRQRADAPDDPHAREEHMGVIIELVGPLAVRGLPTGTTAELLARPKRLALLAWLLGAGPGAVCQRDELLSLFWPEAPTQRARASLRQSLRVLRRLLGPEAVLNRGPGLQVDAALVQTDLAQLRAAIDAGAAEPAVALFRGDLLQGLVLPGAAEFMDWLDGERRHLRREVARLASRQSIAAEHEGRLDDAIRWAHREAQLLPYEERPVSRLMQLLGTGGAPTAAEAAYERLARRLDAQLDDAPSPELQARFGAIAQSAAGSAEVTPVRPGLVVADAAIRVCVAPLVALGGDDDVVQEAEWLAEELAAALAELSDAGVDVVARSRAAAARAPDATTLGRLVDAGFVIDGAVRAEAGGARRMVLRVTDVSSDRVRWAGRYQYRLDALAAFLDRLTVDVARALRVLIEPTGRWLSARRRSADASVHLAWLRAMYHLWRRTPKDVSQALGLLTAVVQQDPRFAAGWAALAEAWILMPIYVACPSAEALPSAREAADRAVALDPGLAHGHAMRGLVAAMWEWDLAAADRHLCEAVRLGPNDTGAHTVLMLYVHTVRGDAAAMQASARHIISLDPLNPLTLAYAALAASYVGTPSDAMAWGEAALELEPLHVVAHWALARTQTLAGQHEQAEAHADTLMELTRGAPRFGALLAQVHARAGHARRARRLLRQVEEATPDGRDFGVSLAGALGALGDMPAARRALQRAIASRSSDVITAASDPLLLLPGADLRQEAWAALRVSSAALPGS